MRRSQRWWGPDAFGSFRQTHRRDHQIGGHRHDEQAWPRLRQEMRGVDNQGANTIAGRHNGIGDSGKIGSAVRGQRAADIFENDGTRRPPLRT